MCSRIHEAQGEVRWVSASPLGFCTSIESVRPRKCSLPPCYTFVSACLLLILLYVTLPKVWKAKRYIFSIASVSPSGNLANDGAQMLLEAASTKHQIKCFDSFGTLEDKVFLRLLFMNIFSLNFLEWGRKLTPFRSLLLCSRASLRLGGMRSDGPWGAPGIYGIWTKSCQASNFVCNIWESTVNFKSIMAFQHKPCSVETPTWSTWFECCSLRCTSWDCSKACLKDWTCTGKGWKERMDRMERGNAWRLECNANLWKHVCSAQTPILPPHRNYLPICDNAQPNDGPNQVKTCRDCRDFRSQICLLTLSKWLQGSRLSDRRNQKQEAIKTSATTVLRAKSCGKVWRKTTQTNLALWYMFLIKTLKGGKKDL